MNLKLADAPVKVRYMRILMTESSNTCDLHGADDVRNCVGYTIREVRVGTVDSSGALAEIQKNLGDKPTIYCTSSIDPWHSAADVNATGGYQHSGFDLFFTSGLTNNLPAMIPVTLLYGTPEDAAAQIAYIEKRGYRIGYVETGEEHDGKHSMPEDYATLYIQWATAMHKVDSQLKLGGPVFEGVNEDIRVWPDTQGRTSWPHFMDGPLLRLFENARSRLRSGFRVVRALSFRPLHHHLENFVQRTSAAEAHPAGVEKRRGSQRLTADGDRGSSGQRTDGTDDHDLRSAVACRQRRLLLRRRWRSVLSLADSTAGHSE